MCKEIRDSRPIRFQKNPLINEICQAFFLYQLESSRKEELGQERKALMSLSRREDADLTGDSSRTGDRAEGS